MPLVKIQSEFQEAFSKVKSIKELEQVRVEFLGKNGVLTQEMKKIGSLAPEQKKEFGANVNTIKILIESNIADKKQQLEQLELQEKLDNESVDITLPPRQYALGKVHPIWQAMQEVRAICVELGFQEIYGPEIEDEWHNFTALNIPEHHPARQMQDTFYLKDGNVLRTHTSNVQIRHMQSHKPPHAVFSMGRVYRSDYDATHTPMFHQLEVLYVDKKVTFANLKWFLEKFLELFFGVDKDAIRLRPSYFPFTEPSAEIDIKCDRSQKNQIILGKGDNWLEILGCGMVHPNVLRNVGIDPEEYQGFALGVGIERLAMLKYNIPDLRQMFEGDIRWLRHYGFL